MAVQAAANGRFRKLGAALLTTTALAAAPVAAFAQATIDGTDVFSVPGILPGGESSPWDVGGQLVVGDTAGSDAVLNIGVGGLPGAVSNTTARVGDGVNSEGTVNVTGAGSEWTSTGTIHVGSNGTGTVTVSDGAQLNANQQVQIGLYNNSSGTVIVRDAGSELISGIGIFVGSTGTGLLRIENGGSVEVLGLANTTIGANADGNGTVVVTGQNSTLTTNGLRVGNSSHGELWIEDEGTVSTYQAHLGYNDVASGTLTISGTGSSLSVGAGGFMVGLEGVGVLVLDDGAVLVSAVGLGRHIGSLADSDGTVTIRNGAHWDASGQVIRIADNATAKGVLNIGGGVDGSGNPLAAAAAGMLTANNVSFGAGNGELNFNHTATAYTFSPAINGNGRINHFSGTTEITDMDLFGGHVNVEGGTLVMSSSSGMTMTMDVHGSGRVGGGGFIRDLTVGSGGTLAPGNSVGTIFAGSATFDAGSVFEIEMNDGGDLAGLHNDFLDVSGAATINAGATFHVIPENGTDDGSSYAANTRYTVIRAGTLNVNAMPTITDAFAFLDFTGSHDLSLGEFYLTSSAVAASFCLPGASTNQCATGEAVRQLGAGNPAYDEAIGFTPAQAGAAFDLASGEIHATGQHVINQTFQLFSRTLRQQASAGVGNGLAGTEVISTPMNMLSAYGPSTPRSLGVRATDSAAGAYADARVQGAWAAPLGARGTIDGDGNAGTLDWWTLGVAGGYEGIVDVGSGEAIAGLAFGYLRSGGTVDARMSSMDADGFHLGAYGAWTDGQWSLAGSAAYAANYVSTQRRIAFGVIDRSAEASYWNHTVGLSTELAYAIETNSGLTISPLFTLDAGWTGHGGYSETGAGALGLTAAGQGYGWLDTGLGISLAHTIETESGRVTFDGRAGWEHAFAGAVPGTDHLLAGSPVGFSVNGPDAGNDRLRLGAGVAFEIGDDLTIRARYDGLFSGSQQSHAGSLGLNVRF